MKITRLALALLVATLGVLVAPPLSAQCGPSATPSTAGLTGCGVPCTCKWRVTYSKSGTTSPLVNSHSTGRSSYRQQSCVGGIPSLSLRISDAAIGQAEIPGHMALGTGTVKVDHIDLCAHCKDNAVMAGWSQPRLAFSGKTEGAAHYTDLTQMQADFSVLRGANNVLAVVETGSSNGYGYQLGFSVSVTPGANPGSVISAGLSGSVTFPTSQQLSPDRRLHITPWKSDTKKCLSETLKMIGFQYSYANADHGPLSDPATASCWIQDAMYCAGISYICKCNPGSHGSGTPGPGPGPGPGGTTGGSGQPGGTTPGGTPGGTTPGGTPGGPSKPTPVGPGGVTTGHNGGEVLSGEPPQVTPRPEEKKEEDQGPSQH